MPESGSLTMMQQQARELCRVFMLYVARQIEQEKTKNEQKKDIQRTGIAGENQANR